MLLGNCNPMPDSRHLTWALIHVLRYYNWNRKYCAPADFPGLREDTFSINSAGDILQIASSGQPCSFDQVARSLPPSPLSLPPPTASATTTDRPPQSAHTIHIGNRLIDATILACVLIGGSPYFSWSV